VTVGLYINISKLFNPEMLRGVVRTTKTVKTYRTNALPTESSVFGALPRNAIRNDYCRFAAQTQTEKQNARILFSFLDVLNGIYEKHLPGHYKRDKDLVAEQVIGDFMLKERQPYSTVNVNVNHAIKYHRDSGNFKGNMSNVLVLKEGLKGGELVFPEYGFALSQNDCWLSIFDGQGEIHGVMPIFDNGTRRKPYRASIVYYTLEQLKHCYPYKQEIERLKVVSTERAEKRAAGINPSQQLKK
jgi:hypothetical protein